MDGKRPLTCSVLRANRIQELAPNGQSSLGDIEQELSRYLQPSVDLEATIQIGVVDETFPADGRARFLKVNAHHDVEVIFCFLRISAEGRGVGESSGDVVHRTRSAYR
jgi:hypothetical protein